jgi:hypothetical protein
MRVEIKDKNILNRCILDNPLNRKNMNVYDLCTECMSLMIRALEGEKVFSQNETEKGSLSANTT